MSKDLPHHLSERERSILTVARAILHEHGSAGLRIADIAQAADISVGTFYSHFESKEDLILALSSMAAQGRAAGFQRVLDGDPFERELALPYAIFCNFLFSLDFPGLYEAEELTANPGVWSAGTTERLESLRADMDRIADTFRELIRRAIADGHVTQAADREQQVHMLNQAAWILMAGGSNVHRTQLLLGRVQDKGRVLPPDFVEATRSMLVGFGWCPGDVNETIRRARDLALRRELTGCGSA
ncbi:MAG: TetR/AcrR family transcriptional regulator [Planctomycetota bacterium]